MVPRGASSHHSQGRTCRCGRGEPREPCPPAPLWCTGSHLYTRVCTHTDVHTQNLLPLGRVAHAHILSGCTVCDSDRVCRATANVWACAGDDHTPRRLTAPRLVEATEPALPGAQRGCLCGKEQLSLACSALTPAASGLGSHRPISAEREVGVGTEQRLGSVPGTVLLGRSQPSSPSGAGQGRAARGYQAIRMSFPFDGPSSAEGRGISVSVPEAGTFPGEVKVEHDQACYNPPSPPKVSPWTPKSPPPAHRGTVAR